jgi:hypothetical protein
MNSTTITDEQIRALRDDAHDHGDSRMETICTIALQGSAGYRPDAYVFGRPPAGDRIELSQSEARAKCAYVIADARAQEEV